MAELFINPLHELHRQAEAEFQSYAELEIVSTFGEPQAEYAAIHKAGALMDDPQRGFLFVRGADRHSFVNNLVTNQMWSKEQKKGLAAGEGVYGFFLNTKGRIVADMNILELGDRLLLEMDSRQVEPVRVAFEKYRFAEKAEMSGQVGVLHQISLYGPNALTILQTLAGDFTELIPLGSRSATLFDVPVTVWRDDPTGSPGYHVVVLAEQARKLWMNLIARFGESDQAGKRALRAVGWAAFNAARIEAGRPLFGIDFDETVLPAETSQLGRAVSFTKGCYLGQEIVARMHARGQAARQICGIRMNDDSLPIAGVHIYAADNSTNQIGGITSSTISPVLSNAAICLGYLKKAYTALGTVVQIPAEGAMRAGTVVELPFLRRD